MISGDFSNQSILILQIYHFFMRILRKLYFLLLSFFDFFHLQLQYDIHVFSRDAYPTQKQYYTYSHSCKAATRLLRAPL